VNITSYRKGLRVALHTSPLHELAQEKRAVLIQSLGPCKTRKSSATMLWDPMLWDPFGRLLPRQDQLMSTLRTVVASHISSPCTP
jgi:hypothetical protein